MTFWQPRQWFPGLAGLLVVHASAQEPKAAGKVQDAETWGIPGPFPGRVIEVRNPRMIQNGVKSRASIKDSVDRGMRELTGADDATSAWRKFFEPGDVVGIKMNPVGNPLANTSSELMLEVIEGIKAAGVNTKDIVVFERYRDDFIAAKMHQAVPDGIEWTGLGVGYNSHQTDLKGVDNLRTGDLSRVTGYDRDEFMVMQLVGPGEDPRDERTTRSHLGLLVTRRVNKIVLLPVLKDHASAGVTGALKNMSHGLVNNVNRSHGTPDTNVCNQFIPAGGRPPGHSQEMRPAHHGRDQGRLPGRPGRNPARVDLGEQRLAAGDRPGCDGPRSLEDN